MSVISVCNLGKKYHLGGSTHNTLRDHIASLFKRRNQTETGSFWALKEVSFDIGEGEVVGIIGRNGAGKSTLLKILSQITEPTEGEIRIRGRVASLLEVGTGFHPELSGRENIFLNGSILGMSKREISAKFDEIIAFAEVEKFIDTPVKHYSSGMYVRLAFAVAAHLEPEILVIDEVLAVGDAAFQQKCLGKMDEVAKRGRTVLFVSHNMPAVQKLCSRCIWIESGTIRDDGMSETVIHRYMDSLQGKEGALAVIRTDDLEIERVVTQNASGAPATVFEPGDALRVEIHYHARKPVRGPYFWVDVTSQFGPVFAASMLLDGNRPEVIEGRGVITCIFGRLPLLPQQAYAVRLILRREDGATPFTSSRETIVAHFTVKGPLASLGLNGKPAEMMAAKTPPVLVPYCWELPDGSRSFTSFAGAALSSEEEGFFQAGGPHSFSKPT